MNVDTRKPRIALVAYIASLLIFLIGQYYLLFGFDVRNFTSKTDFGWYHIFLICLIGFIALLVIVFSLAETLPYPKNYKIGDDYQQISFDERKKRLQIYSKILGIISGLGAMGIPVFGASTYYATAAESLSEKVVQAEKNGKKELYYSYPVFDERNCIPTQDLPGSNDAKEVYIKGETDREISFLRKKNLFNGIYYYFYVIFGEFTLVRAILDLRIEYFKP